MGGVDRSFSLQGRVAAVTGANTGLGRAIAEALADEGASVVITGRDERLGADAENALAGNGAVKFLRADAEEPDEARASVDETVSLLGGLDILVNNAALTYYVPTESYPTSRWIRCFQINVHAPFILSKEVLKDMIPR